MHSKEFLIKFHTQTHSTRPEGLAREQWTWNGRVLETFWRSKTRPMRLPSSSPSVPAPPGTGNRVDTRLGIGSATDSQNDLSSSDSLQCVRHNWPGQTRDDAFGSGCKLTLLEGINQKLCDVSFTIPARHCSRDDVFY